jgi:hypothetical protein
MSIDDWVNDIHCGDAAVGHGDRDQQEADR